MSDSSPIFHLDRVDVPLGAGRTLVYSGLTMEPDVGLVVLRGRSGVGKTVLLSALAGYTAPGRRSACVRIAPERRIYCMQTNGGLQGYSALDNVLLGAGEAHRRARPLGPLFDDRELDDDLRRGARLAEQCSCGQVARLALLRAEHASAAGDGESLLLLDEPTANLDPGSATRVAELLADLPPRVRVVCATHSAASEGAFLGQLTALFERAGRRVAHYTLVRTGEEVVAQLDYTSADGGAPVRGAVPAEPAPAAAPPLRPAGLGVLVGSRLRHWIGPWLLAATAGFAATLGVLSSLSDSGWTGFIAESSSAWDRVQERLERDLAADSRSRRVSVRLLPGGEDRPRAALDELARGVEGARVTLLNRTHLIEHLEANGAAVRQLGLAPDRLPGDALAWGGAPPPPPPGVRSIVLTRRTAERLADAAGALPRTVTCRLATGELKVEVWLELPVAGVIDDSYLDHEPAYVIDLELDARLHRALYPERAGRSPLAALEPLRERITAFRLEREGEPVPCSDEELALRAPARLLEALYPGSGSFRLEAVPPAGLALLRERGYRLQPRLGGSWLVNGAPGGRHALYPCDRALLVAAGADGVEFVPAAAVAPTGPETEGYACHAAVIEVPHVREVEPLCARIERLAALQLTHAGGRLLSLTWRGVEEGVARSRRQAEERSGAARESFRLIVMASATALGACLVGLVLLLQRGNDTVLLASGRSRWFLGLGHLSFFAAAAAGAAALAAAGGAGLRLLCGPDPTPALAAGWRVVAWPGEGALVVGVPAAVVLSMLWVQLGWRLARTRLHRHVNRA